MADSVSPRVIGIVGGSGIYHIDGLTETRWEKVFSPFGEPSDELLFGRLGDIQLVFLPSSMIAKRVIPTPSQAATVRFVQLPTSAAASPFFC